MNTDPTAFLDRTAMLATEPDFSQFDSEACIWTQEMGFDEKLRRCCASTTRGHGDPLSIARDIAYEFAGKESRPSGGLFIHVTGIAEFGLASLRDYGRKHGCTHEWFRREAEAMRKRLDLPLLPTQRSEKIRAKYRL